jgi:hypothetical protein
VYSNKRIYLRRIKRLVEAALKSPYSPKVDEYLVDIQLCTEAARGDSISQGILERKDDE